MAELNATERAGTFAPEAPGPISLGEPDSVASHSLELTTDIVIDVEGIRAIKPDYEHLYRGSPTDYALHRTYHSYNPLQHAQAFPIHEP